MLPMLEYQKTGKVIYEKKTGDQEKSREGMVSWVGVRMVGKGKFLA